MGDPNALDRPICLWPSCSCSMVPCQSARMRTDIETFTATVSSRQNDFESFGRMALPHWPAVIRVSRREINLIRSCFCKPAFEAGIRNMKLI